MSVELIPELQEKIEKVYDMFDSSFLYRGEELILHKKWNVYFRLDTASYERKHRKITAEEFDYKLLSFCSFYCAENHFKKSSVHCKYFWNKINRWFRKDFTYEELQRIYTKIGTGSNRVIGLEFIKSGFNMEVLNG